MSTHYAGDGCVPPHDEPMATGANSRGMALTDAEAELVGRVIPNVVDALHAERTARLAAEQRAGELAGLLREVEWSYYDGSCPSCHHSRKFGHEPDCRIRKALDGENGEVQ